VTLRQWEKSYVEAALNMTHGNLSQAAKLLGINAHHAIQAACRRTEPNKPSHV